MPGRLAKAGLALAALAGAGVFASGRLDGPWGPLPGGAFRGPARACTAGEWQRFASAREVEIEVRPGSPRSVTTWSLVHEGVLYLPADFLTPWKRWPHQVQEDPRIRLRVAGEVFACRATRVEDPVLVDALRRAGAEKYAIDPDGRAARVEVWWFRIGPR